MGEKWDLRQKDAWLTCLQTTSAVSCGMIHHGEEEEWEESSPEEEGAAAKTTSDGLTTALISPPLCAAGEEEEEKSAVKLSPGRREGLREGALKDQCLFSWCCAKKTYWFTKNTDLLGERGYFRMPYFCCTLGTQTLPTEEEFG